MNAISKYWLERRQKRARSLIKDSLVLDLGSRSERITDDAISVDINKEIKPEICATVEYLPLRDESFDYITMLEVIEHLNSEQVHKALQEARRVAKCLLLSTPNCNSISWKIAWYLWSHTFGHEWCGAHKSSFRRTTLVSLLGQCGMQVSNTIFSRWSLMVLAMPQETPRLEVRNPEDQAKRTMFTSPNIQA